MLTKLDEIVDIAKRLKPKRTAVVVAEEELVIDGVAEGYENGLIIPLLIGKRDIITSLINKIEDRSHNSGAVIDSNAPSLSGGIKTGIVEIIDAETDYSAASIAVRLAFEKKVDLIMKGYIHTDILMHQIMSKESGLKTDRLISHIFLVEIKTYKKLIMISDAVINIQPGILEKSQIVQNAIDLALILGIRSPKVAILSATETINPKIQSTIDAAVISKMAERGQIRNGIIDGPLAFDNAISKEAAIEKGIHSDVSGDADIIIVPNIESGNILFKDLEYLAGAQVAGVVLGAIVPVVLTSRSDPPRARLYSIALASILSENYGSFLNYKFL